MSGTYRGAGVDLGAAEEAVSLIRDLAVDAGRPEVVEGVGGFAGLFRLGDGRLLAAATDGVGTKTEVARKMGRLETIGIDLVAMSANDVVCTGAEPLFFLDYVAVGRLVPEEVAALVSGVAEGCRRAGCALLGGETAEHPGVIDKDRFDLAGFCVGTVDEERLLGAHRVLEGDVLVGLASSGPHSNGYSLIRRVLDDTGARLDEVPAGLDRPLGEALLEPTEIYVRAVLEAAGRTEVHAAAHVTGGGFVENVPRALPEGLGAQIDRSAWQVPPVFGWIAERSGASDDEMFGTFNMGIGMVLSVAPDAVEDVVRVARERKVAALAIGRVSAGEGVSVR